MPAKSDRFSVVGKRQPKLDAPLKATGRSQFTDDIVLPGMLHGKILRSPVPRGKILNIDTSRAERLPGVKAVITHRDSGGLMTGPDQQLFCDDTVRCFGDEIAIQGLGGRRPHEWRGVTEAADDRRTLRFVFA